MPKSICGLDCDKCELRGSCGGCTATEGRPFGGDCVIAECSKRDGCGSCHAMCGGDCSAMQRVLDEVNALGIAGMARLTALNAVRGAYMNCEYLFDGGHRAKLLDDDAIYWGALAPKAGTDRMYGIAASERFLLVSETGADGSDPQIVAFIRRG